MKKSFFSLLFIINQLVNNWLNCNIISHTSLENNDLVEKRNGEKNSEKWIISKPGNYLHSEKD